MIKFLPIQTVSSIFPKVAVLILCVLTMNWSLAQAPGSTEDAGYLKAITERADKIVKTLEISDSATFTMARDIIRDQYRDLNVIHTKRNDLVKTVKNTTNKEGVDGKVKTLEEEANAALFRLHRQFVAKLSAILTWEQVEKVKDGLTYGVVPITYKGYLSMLPELTGPQKVQIKAWLLEAREYAMDAESSEKKHAWFGKYKGRINNYLSAAGYDMKKASDAWAERIRAEQAAKN